MCVKCEWTVEYVSRNTTYKGSKKTLEELVHFLFHNQVIKYMTTIESETFEKLYSSILKCTLPKPAQDPMSLCPGCNKYSFDDKHQINCSLPGTKWDIHG